MAGWLAWQRPHAWPRPGTGWSSTSGPRRWEAPGRRIVSGSGLVVDNAPSIIGFPAPWRDLFRKSGRPLEAELARMGYALEPAEPATMIFADGTELILPTDRGGQYATLAGAYGQPVAGRWRSLLDRLDEVWQTLRGLGVEAELRSRRQLNRATRRSLFGRNATLADLATSIDHDHLGSFDSQRRLP